jgi:quercetin dioxygenase-like cupin family protein
MTDYLQTFPPVDVGHDVIRQVIADTPEMMTVSFAFGPDGVGLPHSHPHLQATFVRSGRFQFTIADRTFEVGPGDAFVIPSNAVHSCNAIEPGVLIDTFTPRRDDFL